ncbi:hypothetical protein FBQ82_00690 [Anaerolineae bacterium CFX7]|nr:hypothetical protein [Anaerolineae bacterium CFX7]
MLILKPSKQSRTWAWVITGVLAFLVLSTGCFVLAEIFQYQSVPDTIFWLIPFSIFLVGANFALTHATGKYQIQIQDKGFVFRDHFWRWHSIPWEEIQKVTLFSKLAFGFLDLDDVPSDVKNLILIVGTSSKLKLPSDYEGPKGWWLKVLEMIGERAPQANSNLVSERVNDLEKARKYLDHKREWAAKHLEKEFWDLAAKNLRVITYCEPDDARAHMMLCLAYAGSMDFDFALDHYSTVKQLDPTLANEFANTPLGIMVLNHGGMIITT